MKYFQNFNDAINWVREKLIEKSYIVRTEKWQGIPLEHDMRETLNTSFHVFMSNDITKLQDEIKPNLPWADIHFEERISGIPSNPGESYKIWPYYKMDKEMRTEGERFSHTYMERIWPKLAGKHGLVLEAHKGVRYNYGDMISLIRLLINEPFTRQAFLPIWFPEDTGVEHGGRVPCTIGYHFIRRDNYLHVVYYIRSCDYLRHFRDDIYLAVRKVIWLIEQVNKLEANTRPTRNWGNVKPGIFTMHITSLHCFTRDYYALNKEIRDEKDPSGNIQNYFS